jgi:hypothetical protein
MFLTYVTAIIDCTCGATSKTYTCHGRHRSPARRYPPRSRHPHRATTSGLGRPSRPQGHTAPATRTDPLIPAGSRGPRVRHPPTLGSRGIPELLRRMEQQVGSAVLPHAQRHASPRSHGVPRDETMSLLHILGELDRVQKLLEEEFPECKIGYSYRPGHVTWTAQLGPVLNTDSPDVLRDAIKRAYVEVLDKISERTRDTAPAAAAELSALAADEPAYDPIVEP